MGSARRIYGFLSLALVMAALSVLAGLQHRFPGDQAIAQTVQGLRTPWLDQAVLAVSKVGDVVVAVPLIGATILLLVLFRHRADALVVTASLALMVLGNSLKMLVGRLRPEEIVAGTEVTGFSFPSGHALFALIFGGLLVLLAEDIIRPPWLRRGVQSVLVALVLAIGISRVYLGAHWPSDVLGGYLFGAASLLLLVALRDALLGRGQPTPDPQRLDSGVREGTAASGGSPVRVVGEEENRDERESG